MRAQERDREACFRAFFAAAYDDLLRFVQRRVDPSQAEDVVADAFLVAWRRFGEAPAQAGDRRAWLFGIARGCVLNTRRGQQRRQALAVRVAATGEPALHDGDTGPDWVAARVDLANAWRMLTSAEQEVLALTVFEDLTSAQAAQVLGISPAACRLRLMRARRALRSWAGQAAPAADRRPLLTEVASDEPI
jgi:RNA polymerase sigma-70 factor (ECF subfamily)